MTGLFSEVNSMPLSKTAAFAVAALMTITPAAVAQTQTDPQTQPPPQTQTQPQQASAEPAATQTFTGCLMRESDYRRAHNLGEGAIGGVGLGDEYVLVDVKVSPAKSTAATSSSSASASVSQTSATSAAATDATPASSCADRGVAYRLTGSDEEQLRTLVGRHIEVQGRFKDAAAATAAARPGELPAEVEMVSYTEAPSPAPVSEPVTATPPVTTPPPASTPPTTTPPPASTVAPSRPVADPAMTEPAAERRALPRTAGSTALLGVIGVLALGSGVALTAFRRRAS
jgi:hypothetical protein